MKNFKKCIILLLGMFLLSACTSLSPSEKVENMLNKYIKNDKEILKELDLYIDRQDLNEKQKTKYKEIVKDEYSSIKYEIKDELIDGENATVEVEIKVKDLFKPSREAEKVLIDNPTEFYTNGAYDPDKYVDYKLDLMEKSEKTVTFTIYVTLTYKDDTWLIEELDEATLEKIHGIYDYEKMTE